jgi:hypothetical protein
MSTTTHTKIDGPVVGSTIISGSNIRVNMAGPRRSKMAHVYPAGAIGANLSMRHYVRYLTERYHRYRAADRSFGQARPFSYAVLFKNVESRFKAPTYFIPEGSFDELVDYLHKKIDGTTLGKNNRARGIRNYATWDDYLLGQESVRRSDT